MDNFKLNFDDVLFADLHIHSRFSRACSINITFDNLVKWAKIKGLNLLGTGDFTHPLWLKEIKEKLIEKNGFYYYQDFPFIITGEISLMYSQDRGRRIHLVILVPNLETADKINSYLDTKGRRDYDGRPIFNISGEEFVREMMKISEDIEIIPAHCLLPDSLIHTYNDVKKIKDILVGEEVLTHKGVFKKVKKILVHNYSGKLTKIIPWYFREGLTTTPEHPFYAIKSYKKCKSNKGLCKPLCSQNDICKRKFYLKYTPKWIQAKDIEVGDFLVYPRLRLEKDINEINPSNFLTNFKSIDENQIIPENARNHTGKIKKIIKIDERFCRLLGYFLSEGYLIKDFAIGFSFHNKEKEYIQEVISIIKEYFGFEITNIDSRRKNQHDLVFSSKLLNSFFRNFYFENKKRANSKFIPKEFTLLPVKKLAEIFRGWWRGDTGYTISRQLANQMKTICLKLGIIPSISFDSIQKYEKRGKHFIGNRKIEPRHDLIIFSNLSFFEEDFGMLDEECFNKFVNKLNRKHGWMDKDNIYLPVKEIKEETYLGEVYNLEVEEDNSYVSEFACVHNCWTPWFGVFGSMSGFDSLRECFKEQIVNIHAIETGMSSDPEMNWRIKELEDKAIISFSDAHSFWPFRLGREATIFKKTDSYSGIIEQIRNKTFTATIETDPAYGKYHWDGHRNCNFSCSPDESNKLNRICPVCKRPLTIGVDNRIEQLAYYSQGFRAKNAKLFYRLLPLQEVLALALGGKIESKKVWGAYNLLIENFGNEFNILLNVSKEEFLRKKTDDKIIELILRNRHEKIKVKPGFDGEYGKALMGEKQSTLI